MIESLDQNSAGKESAGTRQTSRYALPVAALLLSLVYCLMFFVDRSVGLATSVGTFVYAPRNALYATLSHLIPYGLGAAHRDVVNASYLALSGIVAPWLIAAALGRGRLNALGVRAPNRAGIRLLVFAYVLSLPFLYWMVEGSGLAADYLPHLRTSGAVAFLTYYAVNMLAEHFFLHGVMLALLRPGFRWPRAREIPEPAQDARLQSSEPSLVRRLIRQSRLPADCTFAVLGSGLLFALVHIGKDPRELVLSLPGGIILAYLAYRTDSFLTPFVLHLATAGTALGMMLAIQ